jgi:hypothetical protein
MLLKKIPIKSNHKKEMSNILKFRVPSSQKFGFIVDHHPTSYKPGPLHSTFKFQFATVAWRRGPQFL